MWEEKRDTMAIAKRKVLTAKDRAVVEEMVTLRTAYIEALVLKDGEGESIRKFYKWNDLDDVTNGGDSKIHRGGITANKLLSTYLHRIEDEGCALGGLPHSAYAGAWCRGCLIESEVRKRLTFRFGL